MRIATLAAIALLLSLAACAQPRPVENMTDTGPQTACASDADCWCASFTGAEFIVGERTPSTCCAQADLGRCRIAGHCAACAYR